MERIQLSSTIKGSYLIGKTVINADNETLGIIEDIIISKISGLALYIVISFGGFMGLEDKFYALPWNSINYDIVKQSFQLAINPEEIKSAPSFKRGEWFESSYDEAKI
jgi:sporulation protein YlmC with PRC-barrel domain